MNPISWSEAWAASRGWRRRGARRAPRSKPALVSARRSPLRS